MDETFNLVNSELDKLKKQNAEFGYLINKVDEQFEVVQNELKYMESLIRNMKDASC